MSESTLTYGLGLGGFVRMRLPEIRRAIFDDITARTGLTFDETPDSFSGQLISIFAEREAAMWELAEAAYLAAYPVTAQGIPLDLAVSFAGVQRLQPARSTATGYFTGQPGTVIDTGSVVQATVAADASDLPPQFAVDVSVTLTKASAVGAVLTIPDPVVAGASYWVDVAGVRYNVVAGASSTATTIVTSLDQQIGNASTSSANTLTIFNPVPFVVDWSTNINVTNITCIGNLVCTQFGPVQALQNTLTKIVNQASGWNSVTNPFAAVPGRNLETDDALRSRYAFGVYLLGAGTLPSIYANFAQRITGIASLRVFENASDLVDSDGRPGHSIELIIEGGDTDAIFNLIHEVKGAGITAYGNTSGTVRGDDGYLHPVAFSRPDLRWIWINFNYTANPEMSAPGDMSGRIVAAIMAAGQALTPGDDVILQRLAASPFNAIPSLKTLNITLAVTAPNSSRPTSFTAADIAIGSRQKAVFDPSRITVV